MKNKLIVVALLSWLGLLQFHLTASAQPVVTTLAASGVSATNATLNGTVNPNGAATTAYFRYGLTTNYDSIGAFTALPATNVTLTLPGFVVNGLPGAAGVNWTNHSNLGYLGHWHDIASSADGIRLTAVVDGLSIFTSTNGGVDWTQRTSTGFGFWNCIASSADGTRLAVGQTLGDLWISTDSGVTWTKTAAPHGDWNSIASSPDGTRLVANLDYGGIYTSMDGGTTWTKTAAPDGRWHITSSVGGSLLAAASYQGGIWTSPNGGVTWTQTSAPVGGPPAYNLWTCLSSSADGTRLVAGQYNFGGIWSSTNSGVTWTRTSAPNEEWIDIASSADGARLAAMSITPGGGTGRIYTSTNGGTTWTQTSAPLTAWNAIATSADGSRLAAVADGGGVWTSAGTTSDLLLGTTYHFRLVGINSAGTSLGSDLTFTTPMFAAPIVAAAVASGITTTNATLNGTLKTGGLNTTAYFRYGLTTNYGSFSVTNNLAATNTLLAVANLISGLSPGTTYHFQFVAANSQGNTLSGDIAFTTSPILPVVTILPATSVSATSATLNGTVNPGNGVTTVYFRYGLTTNYGSFTATNSLSATNAALSVSNLAGSLAPGTTYHFQLVGINSAGTALSGDLTFTASAGAPTANTLAASGATGTSATFNGRLTTGSLNTMAYFRYGLTTNYGSFTATNSLAATSTAVSVSNLTSSLSPVTTYHFQLVAGNSAGTTLGENLSFMTLPLPPVAATLPATSITTTNATLNGTVNPGNGVTTAYFQYGLTTNYGSIGAFMALPATNVTLTLPGFVVNGLTGAAGVNWTNHSNLGYLGHWHDIASSADGIRLTAVVDGLSIFTSTNGGVDWTQRTSTGFGFWNCIASSADGTRLAVGQTLGDLWISTDSGVTWTKTAAPHGDWNSIASSPDGTRLVANLDYGGIYTSMDGGTTWTKTAAPDGRWHITSSVGGSLLAAASYGGGIWTSPDGGVTWTQTSAPVGGPPAYNLWTCLSSSADGTRLVAGQYNFGGIWSSTNSGVTWTRTSAPNEEWIDIASSADGARLAAMSITPGGGTGRIYTSTNGGTTWTQTSAPLTAWNAIASSADGSRLAAVVDGGGVWTSTGTTSGLLPGTTYHFRLVSISSAGTSLGNDLTFTTPILKIAGSFTLAGGAFRLVFNYSSGLHFTVLASTDPGLPLTSWTVLGTPLEAPPGQYQFADVNVPDNKRRFYRVRLP